MSLCGVKAQDGMPCPSRLMRRKKGPNWRASIGLWQAPLVRYHAPSGDLERVSPLPLSSDSAGRTDCVVTPTMEVTDMFCAVNQTASNVLACERTGNFCRLHTQVPARGYRLPFAHRKQVHRKQATSPPHHQPHDWGP